MRPEPTNACNKVGKASRPSATLVIRTYAARLDGGQSPAQSPD